MARLIAQIVRSIVRKLALLIVIVAILVGASLLKAKWREHRDIQASLSQQATSRLAAFERELDTIDAGIQAFETQAQQSRGQYLDLAAGRSARAAAQRARPARRARPITGGGQLPQPRQDRRAAGCACAPRRARSHRACGQAARIADRGRRGPAQQLEQLELRRAGFSSGPTPSSVISPPDVPSSNAARASGDRNREKPAFRSRSGSWRASCCCLSS